MYCNGACAFCSVPCTRENNGKQEKISPNSEEHIGTYEIKRNIFGKETVKKVKNENRTIGIEYTS